ncbi:hypothetical protein CVD19_17960 [Bacillus sp. T33-2]|nr:hypothetical protein CVD19_17960 [Bacillus sp. T33-2]
MIISFAVFIAIGRYRKFYDPMSGIAFWAGSNIGYVIVNGVKIITFIALLFRSQFTDFYSVSYIGLVIMLIGIAFGYIFVNKIVNAGGSYEKIE